MKIFNYFDKTKVKESKIHRQTFELETDSVITTTPFNLNVNIH